MATALLILFILIPPAITYWLKSNAAIGFLAACAGFVLLSLTSSDLQQLLDHANIVRVSTDTLGLILLISPPILTLLATKKSVHGKYLRWSHLLPALCAGGLLALIAVPLFSGSIRGDLANASLWTELQKIQPWIIGVGALSSLLLVWSDHLKPPKKK